MKQATFDLITELKANDQDFEFYPTTAEIIRAVDCNICPDCSILDVGAGRGDVLVGLKKPRTRYAIEKSQILLSRLPKDVFVVGTDFHRQTLIDKAVDVVFSNPPYSEFESWSSKVIREARAKTILLVIPDRWVHSGDIAKALKDRAVTARAVGTYTFANAERSARCVVNLVRVDLMRDDYHSKEKDGVDPFRVWFNSEFKKTADQQAAFDSESKSKTEKSEHIREMVRGRNLIESLEELYLKDLELLVSTYRSLAAIPEGLLKEIGVTRTAVCESLKSKISGTKTIYWQELFDNLNKITDRLTTDSRANLLRTLTENTNIDFSAQNAYAVVIWAIKNANGYMDNQLTTLYRELSNEESARAYKSNVHFKDASFRYNWRWREDMEKLINYKLDYRIVVSCYAFGGYDFERHEFNGISKSAGKIVNDICTIGKNLGFDVIESARSFQWEAGEQKTFYFTEDNGERKEFMQVRMYKNGNGHFKLNQKFMLKLNIEAARILGWIRTPAQAAEEMGEKIEDVAAAFNSSFRITVGSVKLLSNYNSK